MGAESAVGFSASFEEPISTGRIVQDARDLGRRERDESFSVSCTLFRREAPVVLTQRSSGIGPAKEVV